VNIISLFEQPTASSRKYMMQNPETKKAIRQYLVDTGRIENFIKRKPSLNLSGLITTVQEFDNFALKHNLFGEVFVNLAPYKENEYFACELIEGHFAWIARDTEGIYRYFSMQKHGRVTGFNIYDLIEIIDGVDFCGAREELGRLFNIPVLEDEWVRNQQAKYVHNLKVIQEAETEIGTNYLDLYDFLKDHLLVLEFLIIFAMKHVNRRCMHDHEHVFFVSTPYVAENLSMAVANQRIKFDQPAVSRAINMFVLLGLLSKIPYENLPQDLLGIAIGIQGGKSNHKMITFYTMPQITDQVLCDANKKLQGLRQNNLRTVRDITKKNIIQVFGQEEAKKVYLPPIHLGKLQKGQMLSFISKSALNDAMEDIPF